MNKPLKTFISLFWCFVVFFCVAGEAHEIRVLTYNIHHGEGTDGRIDLERIAGVIRSVTPDLVALQEVDVKTGRSGGVNQLSELSRLTGLEGVFARTIPYDGGEYGNAVLSALTIAATQVHRLPFSPGHEERVVLETLVLFRKASGEEVPILFLATHMDHTRDPVDRLAAVPIINKLAEKQTGIPMILAGDLNAEPDSQVLQDLLKVWTDTGRGKGLLTSRSQNPTRRIDYILVYQSSQWSVQEIRVLDETVASDHRPVFAVLECLECPRDVSPWLEYMTPSDAAVRENSEP